MKATLATEIHVNFPTDWKYFTVMDPTEILKLVPEGKMDKRKREIEENNERQKKEWMFYASHSLLHPSEPELYSRTRSICFEPQNHKDEDKRWNRDYTDEPTHITKSFWQEDMEFARVEYALPPTTSMHDMKNADYIMKMANKRMTPA